METTEQLTAWREAASLLSNLGIEMDYIRMNNRTELKRKPPLTDTNPLYCYDHMNSEEFQSKLNEENEDSFSFKDSSITYYMLDRAMQDLSVSFNSYSVSLQRLVSEVFGYLDNKETLVDTYRFIHLLCSIHFPNGLYFHSGKYTTIRGIKRMRIILPSK